MEYNLIEAKSIQELLEAIKELQQSVAELKTTPQEVWLTPKEASARLRICNKTLYNHAKAGKIKFKKLGRKVLYLESDLINF